MVRKVVLPVMFGIIILGLIGVSEDANAILTPQFLFEFGTLGTEDGQLDGPIQASLNSLGNVYVIENGNDRVSVFDSAGTFLFKFGSFCQSFQGPGATCNTNVPGAIEIGDGQFFDPTGIAIGPTDKVYVLDKNNYRVQIFDANGNFLDKFGSFCALDFNSDGVFDDPHPLCNTNADGAIELGDGQFRLAQGITVDKFENIYVADTFNQRIQKFDSSGTFLFKSGSFGQPLGSFKEPSGIAIAKNGDIYVTDSQNHRVQVFDPAGNVLFAFGSFGTGDGQFTLEARGIGIDAAGNVYVGDLRAPRYQIFDLNGAFLDKFGSLGSGEGQFSTASSGAGFDNQGRAYIADSGNNRVQVFSGVAPDAIPEHFLAYDVKETKHTDKFEKMTVILSDQFVTDASYTVEKPYHLYNPVQKTHDGTTTEISDEISHLLGYKIKEPKGEKFEKVTNVLVQNQFGDIIVDVKKPKLLLVPSAKDHFTVPDELNPITINHFKCYDVKESKDTPKFVKRIVSVYDPNFEIAKDFEVKKPKHLCTPVDKNGEGIVDAENHLMCYDLKKMKGDPKFEKRNVFTNNQFEPEDLEVKKVHQLCVPSIKTLP